MVAQSLFLFLMGFLFSAMMKGVTAVLGEGQTADVAKDALKLTEAAAVTGKYDDVPEDLKLV